MTTPASERAIEPGRTALRRSLLRALNWAVPGLSVVFVLLLWELVSRSGLISERHIPAMSTTFDRLVEAMGTSDFWNAMGHTLQGWALGLGIATALAIPIGLVVGSNRWVYSGVRVIVEFLRPIPSVALIPLAVLIYGTGLQSKVFLAAFASFWPVFIQTLYGMQDVDPVAVDTARSFRLSRLEQMRRIKLPSAIPYIATGIRISSAVALILAVTAELVIGSAGLGREINIARSGGALPLMYALIIATGLLGWALNIIATLAEKRVLHWHPSHRKATQ